VLIWNVVGLIDILFVVVTAARIVMSEPETMTEFFHLPLGLLPTFIVPIIIVTHIVIFVRLRNEKTVAR
jgi:hypothetical protein